MARKKKGPPRKAPSSRKGSSVRPTVETIPVDGETCEKTGGKTTKDAGQRLGEFLRENGTITQEELEEALLVQKRTGRKLGAILVDMGLLTEEELCHELSRRLDIPFFDLSNYIIDPKVVELVPEHLCERYRLIALKKSGKRLTVAMINPFDEMALEDLRILTGFTIRPVLATPSSISRALAQAYGHINYVRSLLDTMVTRSGKIDLRSRLYKMLENYDPNREDE